MTADDFVSLHLTSLPSTNGLRRTTNFVSGQGEGGRPKGSLRGWDEASFDLSNRPGGSRGRKMVVSQVLPLAGWKRRGGD